MVLVLTQGKLSPELTEKTSKAPRRECECWFMTYIYRSNRGTSQGLADRDEIAALKDSSSICAIQCKSSGNRALPSIAHYTLVTCLLVCGLGIWFICARPCSTARKKKSIVCPKANLLYERLSRPENSAISWKLLGLEGTRTSTKMQ